LLFLSTEPALAHRDASPPIPVGEAISFDINRIFPPTSKYMVKASAVSTVFTGRDLGPIGQPPAATKKI
jgi:hypothetical protein